MLRQAPNIVMVGEIRDLETAEIAINASLTGHMVFSTLHTNDAPSAVSRLVDMGVNHSFLLPCGRLLPKDWSVPSVKIVKIPINPLLQSCRFGNHRGTQAGHPS